ncbi:MAG: tetratricopeptide repeat protein, partial [Bacteroidota bacterium]
GNKIGKTLCAEFLGIDQPALDWLGESDAKDPVSEFLYDVFYNGFDRSKLRPFLSEDGTSLNTELVNEAQVNNVGYQLLALNRKETARELFRLNMLTFPKSANTYDSYAEVSLALGDHKAAQQYYEKAIEIDPENNPNAKRLLNHLNGTTKKSANHTFELPGYQNASCVTLAGEFNGWNSLSDLFVKENGNWVCHMQLEPGKYAYKIVIDGVWVLDPGNSESTYDGNHNSVILIE